jgi:hypothetical protein
MSAESQNDQSDNQSNSQSAAQTNQTSETPKVSQQSAKLPDPKLFITPRRENKNLDSSKVHRK